MGGVYNVDLRLYLVYAFGVLSFSAPAMAQVSAGVEYDHDRFTYHFDNPSTIDTPQLVPHFFEQRYIADRPWLTARWKIAAAGTGFTTEGGVAPSRSTTADDYDTFFEPDGSVVVAGTTGPASMWAFRIAERVEIVRFGAAAVTVGYRLRVDRADFGVGHKTITRDAALVSAVDVTTRETTSSIVQEPLVGIAWDGRSHGHWQIALDADLAPVAAARLAVQLPDKYPGQNLVFTARAIAAHAHAAAARSVGGGWRIAATLDVAATGGYRPSATITRRAIAAGVAISR